MKIMLDKKSFTKKPQSLQIGAIQNRLANSLVETTINELANYIINGNTFIPAEFNSISKTVQQNEFVSKKIFAFDVDNDIEYIDWCTFLDVAICYDIKPCLIYKTFSYTDNKQKYRIIFELDETITDINLIDDINVAFFKLFAINDNVIFDKSCRNINRIFFGGTEILYKANNTFNYNDLLNNGIVINSAITLDKSNGNTPKTSTTNNFNYNSEYTNNIIKAIKEKDINKFLYQLSLNPLIPMDKGISVIENNKSIIYNNSRYIVSFYLDNSYIPGSIGIKGLDVIEILKTMKISMIFNLPIDKTFNCILHDDKNPSAVIMINNKGNNIGIEKYYCHSCSNEHSLGLIDIIAKIQNVSIAESIEWLKIAFDLKSEYQDKVERILNHTYNYYLSCDFAENYETLEKYLQSSNSKQILLAIINFAKGHVFNESILNTEKHIFFCTKSTFTEYLKRHGITKGITSEPLQKKLITLCRLGLIRKVPYVEIPDKYWNKASMIRNNNGYKYCSSYYEIMPNTIERLNNAETIILNDKRLGISRSTISKKQIELQDGNQIKNTLYVQDVNTTMIDKETIKTQKLLNTYINTRINKNGYVIVSELMSYYEKQKKNIDTIKILLPIVINDLELKRTKVNKDIKEKYNLKKSVKSNSIIIIK